MEARKFDIGDLVRTSDAVDAEHFSVLGWEASDGINPCGRPPRKYRGWFYRIRSISDGIEFIVPEPSLSLIRQICPTCRRPIVD